MIKEQAKSIINFLPKKVTTRIAAGEIIERPVSVIRELIDNSLDADSKNINVNIIDGGKKLIEIIDDGIGMNEEDLKICYKRHTTSKISDIDDLEHLSTMGFRGEALYSISAVARLEIHSKHRFSEEDIGNRTIIENEDILLFKPEPRRSGTSIRVSNIFYNLPVRAKFLKSDQAEFRLI